MMATNPYASETVVSFSTVITPTEAAHMLATAERNRDLRRGRVAHLVDVITRGEWVLTTDAIGFFQDGVLANGQHRLTACVEANLPITALVTYGLPANSWEGMDQGLLRTKSDLLLLDKRIVEPWFFATLIWSGAMPKRFRAKTCTARQMEDLRPTGIVEIAADLVGFCGAAKKGVSAAAVKAAACIKVIESRGLRDYVFTQYQRLAHRKYDELPPVAHSYLRQVESGVISFVQSKEDAFARAVKVFDPACGSLTKIQISDGEIDRAFKWAKAVLDAAMSRGTRAA